VTSVSHLFASETFWLAVGSILTGIGAVVAYSALRYSITTFTKTLSVSNYTELDKMYFDLLKMAVENPRLINPEAARDADQQREYDTYALMVWNVTESIYDRCHGDGELCKTWYPAIDTEEKKHRKWFDDPINRSKFKGRFCRFIDERYPKHKCHIHREEKEKREIHT
jgi:hypothetical protein